MDEVVEATRRDGKRLLLEAAILPKRPEFCARLDAVIAVTAPAEMRLSRVMGRDGLSRQAALERMARAISPEKIRDCATHELVNGADPYDFRMRARELLQRLDTRT
jgi:dephospho-CoA kinase